MSGLLVLLACSCLSLLLPPGSASPPIVTSHYDGKVEFCDPNNHEYCKNYESPDPENLSSIERTKFLNMAVNSAMNEAVEALNHVKFLEPNSQIEREKAALSDCWKFYEFTIHQLNKTLDPSLNSTSFDIQTWLSAALTNLENCKTSIIELNAANPVAPFQKGFQRWIPDGDLKRILQASKNSTKLVVAQDGSGNFRTIKEALEASQRLRITLPDL